jgi:protein involved in polysaccharide export with SLBB domain
MADLPVGASYTARCIGMLGDYKVVCSTIATFVALSCYAFAIVEFLQALKWRGTTSLPPFSPSSGIFRLGYQDCVEIGIDGVIEEYAIDAFGNIILMPPHAIQCIYALDLTPEQLAHEVRAQLCPRDEVSSLTVSVRIVSLRPFTITGAVNRPGVYSFMSNTNFIKAAVVAGDFTDQALDTLAVVQRVVGTQVIRAVVTPTDLLLPGDIVTILRLPFGLLWRFM